MLSTRPASNSAFQTDRAALLGFESLSSLLAFGALLGLLAVAPYTLSGFWASTYEITTYDFWAQAIFLLLAAGAALLLAISPRAAPRFETCGALLLAFLGWNALAALGGIYRHDAWLELSRIFGALTIFFAIRALWKPSRAIWIVAAWLLGMTWVCVPALLDFAQTRYPRQAGPFFNTNLFANSLAMTLPMAFIFPALILRATKNQVMRIGSALPFLICALGLIVTSSKGGFLAALLALFVTAILIFRAKSAAIRVFARNHRVVLSAATLIFLLAFGALAAKTIVPRLQNARSTDDNSTMFRAYIWRSTLDMARARPVLGFGPGAFPHVYPKYARVGYTRSAHQSWLQIAAEGGFPALFLLLGAVAAALKSGAARLQTRDWPLVAGASGAVVALLAHGNVDSGFETTSIVILLAVALAILTASRNSNRNQSANSNPTKNEGARDESPPQTRKSRLDFFWLGATLLLAMGGNQTQKAASGEDARARAEEFLRNGAPSVAAQKMAEAATLDPNSARLQSKLGLLQIRSGETNQGRAALESAAQLQPTRGANWTNLAREATRAGESPAEIERFYARALENNPLDTAILLERAAFRLDSKNSAGYNDLETVLALRAQPYGKYAPVEQIVNLDFARATLLMAPELQRKKQTARLRSLVKNALADCARAQSFVAQNEQMRRETGGDFGKDENFDLESLTAGLRALQL